MSSSAGETRRRERRTRTEAGPEGPGMPGIVGDYQYVEVVGQGATGVVFKAINRISGQIVAIKTLRGSGAKLGEKDVEAFRREIDVMRGLSHQNIVRVLGAICAGNALSTVLEFVDGGSLASIVQKTRRLDESLVALYMNQVLNGLVYLHAHKVIHRDIKGANILLTREGVCKLTDFGSAASICSDMSKRVTVVGSPYWMAPEVINMTGTCDRSDVWSFGATIVELVAGQPPYWGLPPVSAMFHVVQDPFPYIPSDISPSLDTLLHQCFQKDPDRRPSAADLLSSEWFKVGASPLTPRELEAELVRQRSVSVSLSLDSNGDAKEDIGFGGGADREELVKQIEQLATMNKSLKRRMYKAEQENTELKQRVCDLEKENAERSRPERLFRDYFDCLAMAVQINAREFGVHVDINNEELFQRAMAEQIPWNHWPDWVTANVLNIDPCDEL